MRLWLPEKATKRRGIKGFFGAACAHRKTTSTSCIEHCALLFLCSTVKIPFGRDKKSNAEGTKCETVVAYRWNHLFHDKLFPQIRYLVSTSVAPFSQCKPPTLHLSVISINCLLLGLFAVVVKWFSHPRLRFFFSLPHNSYCLLQNS